ncbi:MAG: ankyrin repeat domain-containing protein, partial [Oligoflexia bacterium]|nr:ankyrin repeat domain-containing protein [Oligoflexia bacterium]
MSIVSFLRFGFDFLYKVYLRFFCLVCVVALFEPYAYSQDDNLYRAVRTGDRDKALVLIERGADVNETREGRTLLHIAALRGYIDIVIALIEKEADIHATDKHGETPLYRAVWKGDKDMALVLIKAGADVNVVNRLGRTPLHLAVWKGDKDMALVLIKAGADVNVV